jgi:hypothetical protein
MRRARIRINIFVLAGIVALIWWWFKGGWDKWNILMAVATLLAVVAALFLDDLRTLFHFPKINLHVGHDLIDVAADFDAPVNASWIRGKIERVSGFIVLPFFFPAALVLWNRGSGRGEEPSGETVLRLIQIRLTMVGFAL